MIHKCSFPNRRRSTSFLRVDKDFGPEFYIQCENTEVTINKLFQNFGKYRPNLYPIHIYLYVMRFKKPWLRVKSVDFDFSAKLSWTDYNELNKPTPKSLAYIGYEKSLVELGVPKNEVFHFFALLKSLLFILSHW